MIPEFKNTNDYTIGDLALITQDLKLYAYNVTKNGGVEQYDLIINEDDIIIGILYKIISDHTIPYCQIEFLIGNEIFYFNSHESYKPNIKIINKDQ